MKNEEAIKVVGGVEVAKDVKKKIETVGVRGLDIDKANELGIFQRIGNILSVTHATVMAAYMVYSCADYLFDMIHARKNEINKMMNAFYAAHDKFIRFWSDYYTKDTNNLEIAVQAEKLSNQILRWMQIPQEWHFGDPQRTPDDLDIAIKVKDGFSTYTFRKAIVNREVKQESETWCVLEYDTITNVQTIVNASMDKASALMVAKRMSDNDKEKMYTAAMVRDAIEEFTEITPFKTFKANNTVGKITKTFKENANTTN